MTKCYTKVRLPPENQRKEAEKRSRGTRTEIEKKGAKSTSADRWGGRKNGKEARGLERSLKKINHKGPLKL